MRILITGITGFCGSHLAEYLLSMEGVQVFGTYRWRSKMDNLEDLRDRIQMAVPATGVGGARRLVTDAKLSLLEADLLDASSVRRLLEATAPDRIFHLAAQSFVPTSWVAPAQTMQLNTVGEISLFEAVRELGLDPAIHVAGSSEEYGLVYPHEVPIRESNPLRPLSPYAVSKVAQEMLAWQYHRSYGLRTVVTRAFNHTGPRRGEVFATSNFARQIAEIEKGRKEPVLRVGNLQAKRDWTDVRDMVRAYWLALERGEPGQVYNIGSGSTMTVRAMLDILLSKSSVPISVVEDAARLRPSDVEVLWADSSRFRETTGWTPQIPFAQTLEDLLNYWRDRV